MEYEFYMDIFFLADFYLNLLSLFLTAACLHQKIFLKRLGFAAAIGSFWNSMLIVFPILPVKAELPVTLIVIGGILLIIAFPRLLADGILHLLKAEGCLLLSAGLVNGCYTFVCQQFYLNDPEGLACTGLMCWLMRHLIQTCILHRGKIGDNRYRVSLFYRGNMKEFLALADSGNRLVVPGTDKPVSLIASIDCKGFCETVSGGYYIPYHAVGTERGLLFAVQFEKMEIKKNGRILTIEHPVVAIVKEPLSVNGDFSMILPEAYVPGDD